MPKSSEGTFGTPVRSDQSSGNLASRNNRPIEEWGKLVGDVPAATAILDRFLHHAEIIQITGKSYRMKERACKNNQK